MVDLQPSVFLPAMCKVEGPDPIAHRALAALVRVSVRPQLLLEI